MSKHDSCPKCGFHPSGGFFGGTTIPLHKCRDCEKLFCNECRNGDHCPYPGCNSTNIWWNFEEAYHP
jgi:hypothetical protein